MGCCAPARATTRRGTLCPGSDGRTRRTQQDAPEGATTEVPAAPAEPESRRSTTAADATATGDGRRGAEEASAAAAAAAAGAASGRPPTAAAERRRRRPSRLPKEPAREKPERSQRAERAADRRRTGQAGGTQRRRQPPRRAPLPAAKRELLISVDIGEQRVAVIEDDRVAEVYLERPERRSIAGNIYLGVVDNVLPGMEAAFVEIGLEKNGFLYVDEIVVPELEGKRHTARRSRI